MGKRKKYDHKFKEQVVQAYLNNEGSYAHLCQKYGISDKMILRTWVNVYKAAGSDGLRRARTKKVYSYKEKLSVVMLYLSGECSQMELAMQAGIYNPALIRSWVKAYRAAGPDALKPHKKGRKSTLKKPDRNNTQQPQDNVADANADRVKQLEDELYWLRLENAFLKELRRLRLEDEARERDLPESSTASEESSN